MTKGLSTTQRLLVLSGILFADFLACQISYKAIGSKIDQQGVLREPFFLIPTSALLLLASSASLIGAGITAAKRKM
jgi:hypothetical protein